MSHLRARKQYSDLLTQRLNALDTLRSTLLAVERAAGDVTLMQTYASSTAALRAVLADPALQRAHVDETLDALAAAQADAREIDDAVSIGADMAVADAGVDDTELEAELNALAKDAEEEKTAAKVAALEVPSHSPVSQAAQEAEEPSKVLEHA